MLFLDIVKTFRGFTFDLLPLFIIAFAVSAVATQYFPPRSLDALIRRNSSRPVLASVFFGVLLPVTPGCRVPMAALARRGGAAWTPVLTFIGAGAAAGVSTIIMTLLIGWQLALLRLIVAVLFALVLSIAIARLIESRFAAVAMDSEVETLFHGDFCETAASAVDADGPRNGLFEMWRGVVRLGRVALPWLLLSLFLAALIQAIVPDRVVESFLGSPLSAPRAALIGIPFYFVVGADVPILFVLLKKGMSLGGAVAFMLAAPIVNFPVFSMVGRWLGYGRALAFMAICWAVASALGIFFGYIEAR